MANYRVTIKKEFMGYPWVNSYQVESGGPGDVTAAANELVAFEQAIHSTHVAFKNAHIAPDPDPGRTGFWDIPLSVNGLVDLGDTYQVAGPNTSMLVYLSPIATGLPGKKMYRYSMSEGEVQPAGDRMAFQGTAAPLRLALAAADLFEGLDGIGILTIGAEHRHSTSMAPVRPTSLNTHHGWYNKTEGA